MSDILVMDDIRKTFGSGHAKVEALKGINLKVKAGEFVSIIGPSGSGKSTFLTIAGGLQTPSAGTIRINDKDFTHLSEKNGQGYALKKLALFFNPLI